MKISDTGVTGHAASYERYYATYAMLHMLCCSLNEYNTKQSEYNATNNVITDTLFLL